MQIYGAKTWLEHINRIWASAPRDHDHKRGWENCQVCGRHALPDAPPHNHSGGVTTCRACKVTSCGNSACPICAPA